VPDGGGGTRDRRADTPGSVARRGAHEDGPVRLFAAVRPSPEAVAHLSAALAALVAGRGPAPEVRWIPPDRWHVTICFFGEVAEPRIPEITRRLARAADRSQSGTVSLRRGGHFGRQALYLRLAGDVAPLTTLATTAATAAKRVGIPVEDRRFRPHLTVARGRAGADLASWATALSEYVGPPWHVERLVLVRSELRPFPRYTDVAAWPLVGFAGGASGDG
jgi:RNA 2',3'-cyclic 3'-phosphodiesterase